MLGMTKSYDICIQGQGIVGQTLALLFAKENLTVALVQTKAVSHAQSAHDVRAYALNSRSKKLLNSLRCWPEDVKATEVLAMHIKDASGEEVNFSAVSQGVPALTWVVDVPTIEENLSSALKFQPLVDLLNEIPVAKLSVICEGRMSQTREKFGVEFKTQSYSQHAIAVRLQCEQFHKQAARQWFSPGHILAFLPIAGSSGQEVAVVWSVPADKVENYLSLSDSQFCTELENSSGNQLGCLRLASRRASWPLQWAKADRWAGTSAGQAWVLAGDAAHSIHPLAGQGLNLGLADATALAEVIAQRSSWRDVNDRRLLRQYERSRKLATLAVGGTCDVLQQLFDMQSSLGSVVRQLGIKGFEHSGLLKEWTARQAMRFEK